MLDPFSFDVADRIPELENQTMSNVTILFVSLKIWPGYEHVTMLICIIER